MRDAAATSPETEAARRCLAGNSPAHPILLLRAPFRAHVGSTRSWGAHKQAKGVRGMARASTAAGTGWGRRGYSGELGEALLCVKGRGIGQGFLLTTCRRRRRAQNRREGAGGGTWQRRRIGRRSGVVGARLPRASGTGTCDSTCLLSPWRSQESKRKSEGTNPSPAATN
jgi:hypothetical protein